MGRIDEKYVTYALLGLVQTWFQLFVMEGGFGGGMVRQVFLGGTVMARTRWNRMPMPFRKPRTWVALVNLPFQRRGALTAARLGFSKA